MSTPEYYIGLMSGTSLDGIDGVLMALGPEEAHVIQECSLALPPGLQAECLSLNSSGPDELHRSALAASALATLYAECVHQLLALSRCNPGQIRAIGAHGQTVRHRPLGAQGLTSHPPYTIQLNQPALLAELTGITVVADFRSRDIAAGGQGAPLVPAFHKQVFGRAGQATAVVNIGGMANITALTATGDVFGLDTGPGNVLLDLWCHRHTGRPFDANGDWAAKGQVDQALLKQLMSDPFFAIQGVKSTGRDLFNADWLDAHLARHDHLPAEEVQATLADLTALTIAQAIQQQAWGSIRPSELLVCGGGAHNQHLLRRIQHHLPDCAVNTTATRGWPVGWVEAAAFAWLARQTVKGLPGNEPQVTGARGPRVLGAIYPA